MPKLIMCQGLPASGKSTWARQIVDHNTHTVRVNKDEIRRQLEASGWQWSRENEKDVIKIRDEQITQHLLIGHDVISDDTNYGKHESHLRRLAESCKAGFEKKTFHTPMAVCLVRNRARTGKERVPDKVILDMAARYAPELIQYAPVKQNPALRPAIICDLDGTLSLFADKGHRGPYDASKCDQDDVNVPVLHVLRAFNAAGYTIIYLSGRYDTYREQTMTFLIRHIVPFHGHLYMRAAGDNRTDWIVKGELFDQHIRNRFYIDFVLDDRNQVVNFWRSIGLTCFQVAPGDF